MYDVYLYIYITHIDVMSIHSCNMFDDSKISKHFMFFLRVRVYDISLLFLFHPSKDVFLLKFGITHLPNWNLYD